MPVKVACQHSNIPHLNTNRKVLFNLDSHTERVCCRGIGLRVGPLYGLGKSISYLVM